MGLVSCGEFRRAPGGSTVPWRRGMGVRIAGKNAAVWAARMERNRDFPLRFFAHGGEHWQSPGDTIWGHADLRRSGAPGAKPYCQGRGGFVCMAASGWRLPDGGAEMSLD